MPKPILDTNTEAQKFHRGNNPTVPETNMELDREAPLERTTDTEMRATFEDDREFPARNDREDLDETVERKEVVTEEMRHANHRF